MQSSRQANKPTKGALKASAEFQEPIKPQDTPPPNVDTDTGEISEDENQDLNQDQNQDQKSELPAPADLLPQHVEDHFDDIMNRLEEKDKAGTLLEATAAYLDFKTWTDNEKRAFLVLGIETANMPERTNMKGGPTKVVKMIDKHRMTWISASQILVNTVSNFDKIPCGIVVQKLSTPAGKNYTNLKIHKED